ncbi:MAG: DUF1566 domain-containing protein [Desulfohalobiaceae bacterium]|nr:DUF1566 domain-containing protein [Desulfohalobiaceae bacterium]
MSRHILPTGARACYNAQGQPVSCRDSLQDAALGMGAPVPEPRFKRIGEEIVLDLATDLCWPRDLSAFAFPVRWKEALRTINELNRDLYLGRSDWRMPNRRELRSLIWHSAKKPALPPDHPFRGYQITWYWTSTSSAMYPSYAWHIHLEGGRMFWGRKDQFFMLWPVCSQSQILPRTGQTECFDERGASVNCSQSGQDAEALAGAAWPVPRFQETEWGIRDRLTGLIWHPEPNAFSEPADWEEALQLIEELNSDSEITWHLPNINELESLVDASRHTPALPGDHPLQGTREVYWSSTTSGFETDWAYALYMHKGAVGVGHKSHSGFGIWPVAEDYG